MKRGLVKDIEIDDIRETLKSEAARMIFRWKGTYIKIYIYTYTKKIYVYVYHIYKIYEKIYTCRIYI